MTPRPEQVRLTRQWVAKAEEDLFTAEHMLKLGDECPLGTVCFHAQQCAEKYLKALLTYEGLAFPKTHDLVVLYNRLVSKAKLDIQREALQPLNRYSIEARYPGDWEPIDAHAAREAVDTARRVRDAVRRKLPLEAL